MLMFLSQTTLDEKVGSWSRVGLRLKSPHDKVNLGLEIHADVGFDLERPYDLVGLDLERPYDRIGFDLERLTKELILI